MPRVGYLTLTKEQTGRRDFLKAGSLGFLGLHLSQFLATQSTMAATTVNQPKPKAQACILIWLEGGPSHIDTWDPKPSSSFRPISTNVPGVQISELLPQLAKHMDKLAIMRTMRGKGNDHPQGTHYAVTGHEINAAMTFPSIGSIIAKEAEPRNRNATERLDATMGEQPPVRGLFPGGFSRVRVRSDVHPRSQHEGFWRGGLELPEIRLPAGCRKSASIPRCGGPPLSYPDIRGRARQHGPLQHSSLADVAYAFGTTRLRSL
jgi:Protein of unknown function (DUF1501)